MTAKASLMDIAPLVRVLRSTASIFRKRQQSRIWSRSRVPSVFEYPPNGGSKKKRVRALTTFQCTENFSVSLIGEGQMRV
jgi:hypothetical protein